MGTDNVRRNVRRLLSILVGMTLLGGCEKSGSESSSFAFESIARGRLVDSVLATGRVHTVRSVDVSSQLSGRIDEVFVDFNDVVAEGAPLARLDLQSFQSRVEELTAALAIAEAELLAAEASLQGARARSEEDRRDFERKTGLMEKGSISDSDVSRARATMVETSSALGALTAFRAIKAATINASRASLRQAEIDLERATIRAPIAGIVIKRSIEPGQTVAVSLSAPELFIIAEDLSQIEIHARVDEADVGKVNVGQTVSFSVDAHPGRRFEGIVHQIRKAPEISHNVVSYAVVIEASNPNELMLPGMTALVEIITASKDDVLRVPNAALRFEMPTDTAGRRHMDGFVAPGVWVSTALSGYQRAELELGYSDGEYSEVLAGDLDEGARVIVGYDG